MKEQITILRKYMQLALFFVLTISVLVLAGNEITVSAIQKVNFAGNDIIQVKAIQKLLRLLARLAIGRDLKTHFITSTM